MKIRFQENTLTILFAILSVVFIAKQESHAENIPKQIATDPKANYLVQWSPQGQFLFWHLNVDIWRVDIKVIEALRQKCK